MLMLAVWENHLYKKKWRLEKKGRESREGEQVTAEGRYIKLQVDKNKKKTYDVNFGLYSLWIWLQSLSTTASNTLVCIIFKQVVSPVCPRVFVHFFHAFSNVRIGVFGKCASSHLGQWAAFVINLQGLLLQGLIFYVHCKLCGTVLSIDHLCRHHMVESHPFQQSLSSEYAINQRRSIFFWLTCFG